MEGSWLVGVDATWSLFEGGATLSKIREARVRLKEIEARGEQMALDIALEVHQATLAVKETAEKIWVAAERRKWAEKALQDVQRRYRNQMATVDTLLQSEVAFNQADVSYTARSVRRKNCAGPFAPDAGGIRPVERGGAWVSHQNRRVES